ncbi:MAG: DnaJ domain-containing protein [Syntrophobacteraceae bacterium]
MHRSAADAPDNSFHVLARLVATERNPHNLISRVVSDAALMKHVRRIYQARTAGGNFRDYLVQICQIHNVPPDYCEERLRLIWYVLRLAEHEQDYYSLLEVERDASPEEVKHAFRRLSRDSHPDANPKDPHADERFRSIYRAYEILSDPILRRHYDLHPADPHWIEESSGKNGQPSGSRQRKRHRLAYEIGLLVALLLALTLLVDYQQIVHHRYKSIQSSSSVNHMAGLPDEENKISEEIVRTVDGYKKTAIHPQNNLIGPSSSAAMARDSSADLDKSVRQFLDRYVRAHETRNTSELLRLFEPDALVNGEPIANLSRVYQESFRKADLIECKIKPKKWTLHGEEVEVSGSLHLSMRFPGDSPLESGGSITFRLIRQGDTFSIKQMNYVSD